MNPPVPTESGLFQTLLLPLRFRRPCTQANAKIMKPAPLRLQLNMYIFISHIFALADSSPCPSSSSLAKVDLNVSLARLFIRTKRWILIITGPVTCLDMSRDDKKIITDFPMLSFFIWSGIFFLVRCGLKGVNIKRWNYFTFLNNVKQRAKTYYYNLSPNVALLKATLDRLLCFFFTYTLHFNPVDFLLSWRTTLLY